MLLRPYYELSHSFLDTDEVSINDLVVLLLNLSGSARLLLIKMFDIRRLILFLRAVSKNEAKDELYKFNEVSKFFCNVWKDLIKVINDFECLKLVDQYSIPNDDWELAIDSDEYEFLLEYVFDIESAEVQICFPLIDVQTTKFNKIFSLLEKHSHGLKISNDRLSVIKDSEILKKKLLVLDFHNYENFEIAKTLKFETLNVIGNEIDNFTVIKLISNNNSLKTINFKNRSKDLVPLQNTDQLRLHYDIAIYDTFSKSLLGSLGSLDQINELYFDFNADTDITLNWLKNCRSLKKLYFSLSFETTRVEIIDMMGTYSQLEHLVLKRCEVKCFACVQKFIMPKLRTITFIDCAFDFSFLEKLNVDQLVEVKLINCEITYDKMIKLPRNLQNLTIINEEIDQVKDFVFVTLQGRETCINPFFRINLNVNDFVVTLNAQDCHDIFMCRKGFGDGNLSYLNFIEGSKIIVSIFPHFDWFDLSPICSLVGSKKTFKTVLEIYSLSNQYQDFNELDLLPNFEKRLYDVYELFEYLQLILQKEELDEKDKMFLIKWRYMPRLLTTNKEKQETKRRSKTSKQEKFSKNESKNNKTKRGKKEGCNKILSNKVENASALKVTQLPYSCNVCKKSFARTAALNRHALIHRDMRPFLCEKCGYSFKRADHLRVHKRACSGLLK